MAQLDIKITTKYEDAIKGANKVTDSYKKLGNEMVKTSQEGKSLDDVMSRYADSLSKALINEEKTKDGMAALTSQAKILKSEMAKVGLSIGEDNELYKKMSNALKQVQQDMAKVPATTKKAASGFDDIGKSSGNAVTKLLSVAKNILKFQLLMGPITAAVRGFRNTISDSLKVSAEAEQRFNKLATVFDGLADSAKSAASAIAAELGVATSTAASALSTVGDLLQAQGMGTAESLGLSSEWVKQFQDIIAFKDINMSLEEFAQNFMSGAAGNLRNFRTFGSIVKESAVNARLAAEGMDTLTGSELELAKMTTRATIALEQQENAMGATQREWDTMLSVNRRLNEAWKEYKENLGDSLNRFLKPAKSWLAEILDYSNDVAKALKEIKGGEFTVKVQQETSEEFLARIRRVIMSMPQDISVPDELGFLGRLSEATGLAGGATIQQQYASGLTAQQLRDVILSTGATVEQLISASEGSGVVIDKALAEEAMRLADAYRKEQQAIDDFRSSLISSAESADTFIESMASLANINYEWSDLVNIPKGMAFNADSLGIGAGEMNTIIGNNISAAINSIYNQLAGMGSDKFANPIDLMFGLNNKGDDLQAWMDEVRKFYEILANRQKKFGDVSDYELERVMKLWKSINDQLDEYNNSIKIATARSNANSTMASALSGYHRLKYESGLTGTDAENAYDMAMNWDIPLKIQDFAKAMRDAGVPLTEVVEKSKEYQKVLEDEAKLKLDIANRDARDALLKGYRDSAAGYREQWANFGLSDVEITRNKLKSDYDQARMKGDQEEINATWDVIEAFEMLQAAIKEEEEELKRLQAWQELGNRALGSTGTLGSVVSQFTDEEGTIWTDILNAILTILENTEGWQDLASTLDQIFAMFEPVVDAIIDVIVNLPWSEIIFMLKVIASAITIIMNIVRGFEAVINWLWGNLKIAFDRVATRIYNLFHPWDRQNLQAYRSWDSLMDELNRIADETNDRLERIWAVNEEIARNTSKDNLALLRDLYNRNIINEDQFYAGARVVQANKVFDPVTATGYITDRQSASVSYGNVTITINGGDPTSVEEAVYRAMVKAGYSVNTAIGGM